MSFEMAVATTALYRPGPAQSGMMDTYVSVARGYEDAHSLHPSLDELTKETNGVLVYQAANGHESVAASLLASLCRKQIW
ncbi:hypothetical protein [Klebsiella quasipneumoniae]|uniref:hypothetical protein n=1 Tax=Klebsiella quasipneumoniae TaxID=1463165 RepID=UPI003D66367D